MTDNEFMFLHSIMSQILLFLGESYKPAKNDLENAKKLIDEIQKKKG